MSTSTSVSGGVDHVAGNKGRKKGRRPKYRVLDLSAVDDGLDKVNENIECHDKSGHETGSLIQVQFVSDFISIESNRKCQSN